MCKECTCLWESCTFPPGWKKIHIRLWDYTYCSRIWLWKKGWYHLTPLVLKIRKSPIIHAKGGATETGVYVCSFKNWIIMAWQRNVTEKIENWIMIRKEVSLAKWTQLEYLLSRQLRVRTWCVLSDHGTFITQLSHQGEQTKKEHSQPFFSHIYSCPSSSTSHCRDMHANLIFLPH